MSFVFAAGLRGSRLRALGFDVDPELLAFLVEVASLEAPASVPATTTAAVHIIRFALISSSVFLADEKSNRSARR